MLEQTLSDCPNVTILWQDVLKTDLVQVRDEYAPGKRMKVVANLPYYVTTPILMQLLEQKDLFESITVMVQKEVADRICSGPGSKEYGAISLAVQYYAQPEAAIRVAPSCFIPHPNVDSTVLYLRAYEKPPVEADEPLMFALIRAAFNQRRKTLANAVSHGLQAPFGPFAREQVAEALKTMNLPETVRGEALSLEQYAALSKYLGYDTLNPV